MQSKRGRVQRRLHPPRHQPRHAFALIPFANLFFEFCMLEFICDSVSMLDFYAFFIILFSFLRYTDSFVSVRKRRVIYYEPRCEPQSRPHRPPSRKRYSVFYTVARHAALCPYQSRCATVRCGGSYFFSFFFFPFLLSMDIWFYIVIFVFSFYSINFDTS